MLVRKFDRRAILPCGFFCTYALQRRRHAPDIASSQRALQRIFAP
jgi:hypothetical protein